MAITAADTVTSDGGSGLLHFIPLLCSGNPHLHMRKSKGCQSLSSGSSGGEPSASGWLSAPNTNTQQSVGGPGTIMFHTNRNGFSLRLQAVNRL